MNQFDKENQQPGSTFYFKIKKNAQIYQSMEAILEKLEINQNMVKFENLIMDVFDQEIIFAVSGLLKRTKINENIAAQVINIKSLANEFYDIQRKFEIDIQLHKFFKQLIMYGRANQILIRQTKQLLKHTNIQLSKKYNQLEKSMKKISLNFPIINLKLVILWICIKTKIQILKKSLKISNSLHKNWKQVIQLLKNLLQLVIDKLFQKRGKL